MSGWFHSELNLFIMVYCKFCGIGDKGIMYSYDSQECENYFCFILTPNIVCLAVCNRQNIVKDKRILNQDDTSFQKFIQYLKSQNAIPQNFTETMITVYN